MRLHDWTAYQALFGWFLIYFKIGSFGNNCYILMWLFGLLQHNLYTYIAHKWVLNYNILITVPRKLRFYHRKREKQMMPKELKLSINLNDVTMLPTSISLEDVVISSIHSTPSLSLSDFYTVIMNVVVFLIMGMYCQQLRIN